MSATKFRKIRLVTALLLVAASASLAAQNQPKKAKSEELNLSIGASKEAGPKEVGLRAYPGAKLHKENDKDDPTAQLWGWLNGKGLKLVVVKMESQDSPERVAAFYRKELARYGAVLDCSSGKSDTGQSSGGLKCDDDKPEPGKLLYKSGTKDEQHLVGVEPNGSGSVFQLVYVKTRGSED